MFLLSPCLCSFLCLSLCLSLWPSLCLTICLCSYLCLSWARRLPLVWCRSRPLCTIVCTLDASLSAHSWEHHTLAASSRSDQRVFRHSGSCGLCASIALIVSWSVSELCASYCRTNRSHSSKAWPLSPTHGNCSNCISIARYRLLCVGSHSSRKRLQISNPLPGSLSFVIIWSARSFVCIVSMNASCLARLFCSSFLPDKGSSRNGFPSTSTSSTQSSSSTAEMYCRVLNDQPSHWSLSPANVSGSFPTLRSTKFTLASWAKVNWSSCCSFRIDRRSLSHQLFLLMFDHCALLTHLRSQLLRPLRKFFHPDSSDVPKHPRRLPGSVVVTTSSAPMRGRVTEWDFFLSCRWWDIMTQSLSRIRPVAGAHVWAMKMGWKRRLLTQYWQLKSTRLTQATVFHNLCCDQHEISADDAKFHNTHSTRCTGRLLENTI